MIDRLARNPHQYLNLKNEWCLSRKPALENKGKSKANTSGPTGKEERPEPEEAKWKRGRQSGDRKGEGEAGQEDQERPGKRRNRRKAPEREVAMDATNMNPTSTGASTPVSVKVKRIEKGNKKGQDPYGNQY